MKPHKRQVKSPEEDTNLESSSDSDSDDSVNEIPVEKIAKQALEDIKDISDEDSSSDDGSMSESDNEGSQSGKPLKNLVPGVFIDRGSGIGEIPSFGESKGSKAKKQKEKTKAFDKGSITRKSSSSYQLVSSLDTGLQDGESTYINVDSYDKPSACKKKLAKIIPEKETLKKSVIQNGFESRLVIPQYEEGLRQAKKQRRIERSKDNGRNWFNMPAQEMTEDKVNDLTVLKMRKVLDPKRFYKGFDTVSLPKFFQRGRIVEDASDFYSCRIPKKQRKATLVDELLSDTDFRKRNKEKYTEIMKKKTSTGNTKKKDFRNNRKRKYVP